MPAPTVAVVTGAGSPTGIGHATALALGRAGHALIVVSTTDRIHERTQELRAAGCAAVGVVADLTTTAGVQALQVAAEAAGPVDVLVNNAGMAILGTMDEPGDLAGLDPVAWQRSLDRNLTTAYLVTRALLPGMKTRGYGRIVNVA